MKRQPEDVEISILALFDREPLNRHGAHRVGDIGKQMPADSISEDNLTMVLADMIHAGWLVGRILPGPGGVAADIVEIDITPQGTELLGENEKASLSTQVARPTISAQSASTVEPQAPKCFICYSWDSQQHRDWVRKLAEGLRAYHVDAVLDRWSAQPGTDLAHFMEQSGETDFVVVVCTPEYAQKADAGEAGVGYEKRIITAKLRRLHPNDGRIIPVLRGVEARAIPTFLNDLTYIDFTSDGEFNERLQELARAIFRKPEYVPPPLGPMPTFLAAPPLYVPLAHKESQLGTKSSASVPYSETGQQFLDPIDMLQLHYQEQPFYALWAWPRQKTNDFIGTQDPRIRGILKAPPGRGRAGFTLDSSASKASIVQEGLHFSSAQESYDLSDQGSMLFSRSLDGFVLGESTPVHTMHPLPLIEYTLSFLQLLLKLWQVNHAQDSLMGSLMGSVLSFNARLYLCNAVGWELRPGSPGTEGYGRLYDKFGPRRPLASDHLLAPSTGTVTIGIGDNPSQATMALMQSVYSAFGYAIEDIPYFDPERLVFRF
ncbi:MAG TPA: toll/interleukin-1 receptor domain-containing protein [Candidatus Deferrimicrobium sp.]|nr:toll/interleukin-1 receptor domain-containing protein [Candidatus Deferrimicrobium sp.]